MERIEWLESFALGFPEIDEDHHTLFDLLNDMMDTLEKEDKNTCADLAEEFVLALKRHYPREEQFLKKINYSSKQEHIAHHRRMLVQSEEFAKLCRSEIQTVHLEEMLGKLVEHLLEDVRHGDLNFRTDLRDQGLDQALADKSVLSHWI